MLYSFCPGLFIVSHVEKMESSELSQSLGSYCKLPFQLVGSIELYKDKAAVNSLYTSHQSITLFHW